jgi:hypothetical protein
MQLYIINFGIQCKVVVEIQKAVLQQFRCVLGWPTRLYGPLACRLRYSLLKHTSKNAAALGSSKHPMKAATLYSCGMSMS